MRYPWPVFALASLSLSLLWLASLCVGPVSLSPAAAILSLVGQAPDAFAELTVWTLRMPRSLMAMLVGAGLGLAGAAMQGVLRNPLAEPGLAGVSSGAAIGAALILTFNLNLQPQAVWLPVASFSTAVIATFCVVAIARAGLLDRNSPQTAARIILAGIAMNAFVTALLGLASYWADDTGLRNLTFWTLGSVARAQWVYVAIAAAAILLPAFWLIRRASQMNALMLGEAEAAYLGLNVRRFQWWVLAAVALMVGVATAFCGIVGFIGLVAPHLVRLLLGADYRKVLLLSPLVGAGLLLLADMLSRIVVAPAELPVGIITALLGTPFFIALQLRPEGRGEAS